MSRALFDKLYRQLNPEQKRAVDEIDGPVFVVAGPGTGKTQILTLRLANILLKTDTPPDALLALTFTRSGVFSMRERLRQIIGPEAYRVGVHTFHGFCRQVIGDYPDAFSRLVGASPATILDQIKILRTVLATGHFRFLRPTGNPDHYLRAILVEIERLKRETVGPLELRRLLGAEERAWRQTPDLYHRTGRYAGRIKKIHLTRQRALAKNSELARVYRAYEAALRAERLYDFGDMVMEVIKALRHNKTLLAELQESFHYFLADEHQDANQAQNELLELLSAFHASPNLFIVGDEKQAIYQFQGASLDNFERFKKKFPAARLIALRRNYRSSQPLLDAAWSLMKRSTQLSVTNHPRLLGAPASQPGVEVYAWSRPELEPWFVATTVAEKLRVGKVKATEIAIIYRNNRDRWPLMGALNRVGVRYSVLAADDVLTEESLWPLLTLFRAVANPADDAVLAPALFLRFLRLPAAAVHQAILLARAKRETIFSALVHSRLLPIRRWAEQLTVWHRLARQAPVDKTFEALLRESGWLAEVLTRSTAARDLEKLRSLFRQAKNLTATKPTFNLLDFVSYLDLLTAQGVPMPNQPLAFGDGVRLLTAHRAKGLEFDWVFIVGANDAHWGGERARRDFHLPLRGQEVAESKVEDERRLFYVALTRARRGVVVSYARQNERGDDLLPSRFLSEIDSRLATNMPVAEWEDRYARLSERGADWLQPPRPRQALVHRGRPSLLADRAYVRELFRLRGLSATGLNNYLQCPWRFFFQNLLRLPGVRSPNLLYGEAVHRALYRFFERQRRGEKTNRRFLLSSFTEHLRSLHLDLDEERRWRERGERALRGYYENYRRVWLPPRHNEFEVRGAELAPALRLVGKIDKIEELPNGAWRVVDYKTGAPKLRDEAYRRQLLFYCLLLQRRQRSNNKVSSALLDFIEPLPSGRYAQAIIEPRPEEIENLADTIRRAAKEILSLAFLGRRCSEPKCQFCRLRQAMGD